MEEIRFYYQNLFMCRSICPDLDTETVTLKEIAAARVARRRELKKQIEERTSMVDALMGFKNKSKTQSSSTISTNQTKPKSSSLKRYLNE